MKPFGIQIAAALALVATAPLAADTVTLNNGDQLSGKVLSEQGDTLVFQAEMIPNPLDIPLASVASIVKPAADAPSQEPKQEPTPKEEPKPEPAPKPTPAPEPTPEPIAKPGKSFALPKFALPKFELPENWDAWVGLGYTDRDNESTKNREFSAEARLAWKGERQDAEWRGFYRYHRPEGKNSADRYGASQRFRHRGEQGYFFQARTTAEVDNVTKNRSQISQTAGLGYSPFKEEHLTVSVTPGFMTELVRNAERKDQNRTSYKAHVEQDAKWKINEDISMGQGLNYSIDPAQTENWDLDINAFVEMKVSEDVNLRLAYRRDFLNQSNGADDKIGTEVGASLVWDF